MAPPDDEKMTFFTPTSLQASSKLMKPMILMRASKLGSATERRTSICAAWWFNTSGLISAINLAALGSAIWIADILALGFRFLFGALDSASRTWISLARSMEAAE